MLRDVSRDTFVHAVEKGILRNSSLTMPTLRARDSISWNRLYPHSTKAMSSISPICRGPAPWCAAKATR